MTVQLDASTRVAGWTLWFGLLAGHVAWSVQLMLGYFLNYLACATGWAWPMVALHATTVVALVVTAAAGLVSYRSWRRLADVPTATGEAAGPFTESARARFMAVTGLILSGAFAFVLVLSGLAGALVPACPG